MTVLPRSRRRAQAREPLPADPANAYGSQNAERLREAMSAGVTFVPAAPKPLVAPFVLPGEKPPDAIYLTVPYPPSANHFKVPVVRNGRAHFVLSKEAKVYKDALSVIIKNAAILPFDGAVAVTATVYRPRKVGDLDNALKLILDSLTGFAYHDDEQIVKIMATRHDDKHCPRVEIIVEKI